MLSDLVKEVEAWLEEFSYGYVITKIEYCFDGEYRFYIVEQYSRKTVENPDYFLVVGSDGIMLNDNGENVVEVSKTAYSNDSEILLFIKDFEEKYIRKENV